MFGLNWNTDGTGVTLDGTLGITIPDTQFAGWIAGQSRRAVVVHITFGPAFVVIGITPMG